MILFLLRRLVGAAVVVVAVAALAFLLVRFVGDPVNQIVGLDTSPAARAALAERLGLNDPVWVQFGRFLAGLARGDFGVSYQFRQPVADLFAARLPATAELALVALLLALGVGIPLGVHTAIHPRGPLTRVLLALSLVGVSLPTFLIGVLLIYVFSVQLGWLPSFGRGETVRIGPWTTGLLTLSGRRALVLPAVTLALFQATLVMRLVRAEMTAALRSDHVRFARARGLSPRAIHYGHAFPNTLVPVVTIVGLQLGSVVAFAIITETVFQWPGMGLLFLQAIQNVDIPIMAAYLVLTALLFVGINLCVDLLYAAIDPRVRIVGRAAA